MRQGRSILRESWEIKTPMDGLQRLLYSEWVDSKFNLTRSARVVSKFLHYRSLKLAKQILGSVEKEWKRRMGIHIGKLQGGSHQIWTFLWADDYWITSHSKKVEQMMKELIEGVERWALEPKPASLWWVEHQCERGQAGHVPSRQISWSWRAGLSWTKF